jgi:predicted nicotinamide N-methyase
VSGLPEGVIGERIELGPFSVDIQRPIDAERLIDDKRFQDDEFLPYWAEVWASGVALARHVAALDLDRARVLELGCGLALPSLAAARVGAEVLATDWAPEAVELAKRNAAANGLRLETMTLSWMVDAPPSGAFDLVLAADVLYERRNTEPLLHVLGAAVAVDGEALVADPGRRHADAFFERARSDEWTCEHLEAGGLPRGGITRLRRARRL